MELLRFGVIHKVPENITLLLAVELLSFEFTSSLYRSLLVLRLYFIFISIGASYSPSRTCRSKS